MIPQKNPKFEDFLRSVILATDRLHIHDQTYVYLLICYECAKLSYCYIHLPFKGVVTSTFTYKKERPKTLQPLKHGFTLELHFERGNCQQS